MAEPARFGRYTLIRPLGEGGQGRVVEALQHGPGGLVRKVALKLLDHDLPALYREARLASLLRHPHLVDVTEVGEQDGVAFCAMELCDRSLAGAPPLSPHAVVEVGLQVCDALAYAHGELGLVHLDLKPANLLIRGGVVKVGDLGIARARGFQDDGTVRGTPRFMAPEQRFGEAVDARADIFALGKVLQDLASGGQDDATLTMGFSSGGPTASCPVWLAPIVDRCTEPDARDRYPSMSELALALRALAVDGEDLASCLGLRSAGIEPAPASGPPIGRDGDLARIRAALGAGLLVLKGPAGIGKSRVARELLHGWPGPAWRVDLSVARDAASLVRTVADALGIPLRSSSDAEDQVGAAIAARGAALIVVDDVEPVAAHLQVVARWCARAPELTVLLTSRMAFDGGRVLELGPLDPDASVELLVHGARLRGVDVVGDPALPELARRLDGVPLALELAAGRLGVLTPSEVLDRLDLSLLRSGAAGLPARQATLQGALDWSWDLLSEADRTVLAELSVFVGSFGPDDARAVCDERGVAGLARLAEHSLVSTRDGRLVLLGTVRAYAGERLTSADEVRDRHARWFARHGAPAVLRALDGPARDEVFGRLSQDLPDLEAAVAWSVGSGALDAAAGAALAAAKVFDVRGPVDAGLLLLGRAIDAGAPRQSELRILRSTLALRVGQPDLAAADLIAGNASGSSFDLAFGDFELHRNRPAEAAVSFRKALADPDHTGRAWLGIGATQLRESQLELASTSFQAARDAARRTGDRALEASAWSNLGVVARHRGRPDEARSHLERALRIDERMGAPAAIAASTANLAILEAHAGRAGRARELFSAAVEQLRVCGFRSEEALHHGNLAELCLHLGELDSARSHARQALEHHERAGSTRLAAMAYLVLGRVERWSGGSDARTLLESACNGARPLALIELARLDLHEGQPSQALVRADEAVDALAGSPVLRALGLAVRGEARSALGLEGARADLEDAVRTLRASSPPLAVQALCAGARALRDPSWLVEAEQLARSADLAAGSPTRRDLEHTLAWFERGEAT